MLQITDLSPIYKVNINDFKKWTIDGWEYPKYPIFVEVAYTTTINSSVLKEDFPITCKSNHIKWKPFIVFMTEDKEVNELIYNYIDLLYEHNCIRRPRSHYQLNYDYNNSYNILKNTIYKGYKNNIPNTFLNWESYLYIQMKQGNTQKAFYEYIKIFNSHSHYKVCKTLEYIYKINRIIFLNKTNNDPDFIKYLSIVRDNNHVLHNDIYVYDRYKTAEEKRQTDIKENKKKMGSIKNNLEAFRFISTFQGKILTFSFKGLLLKLIPPVYDNRVHEYNYTHSLLVKIGNNWESIYDLPLDSPERKIYFDKDNHTEEETLFRYDLLLLMRTKRISMGFTGNLINHLIRIENNYKYLKYYVIRYTTTQDNDIHTLHLSGFSKKTAELDGNIRKNYFKSEILSIDEYPLNENNEKKVLYDK